jgi:hypothetical protein
MLEQLRFFQAMRPQMVKKTLKIRTYLPESTSIVLRDMVQSYYDSFQIGMQLRTFVP